MDEPALGHRSWVIPDGYLSAGEVDGLVSHEAVCILNTGDDDALDRTRTDGPPADSTIGVSFAT